MELSRPPPLAGDVSDSGDDISLAGAANLSKDHDQQDVPAVLAISSTEWSHQLADLAPKLMCLTGTDAYKFSRDRLLKRQWQHPVHKTLIAVGKGFMSWTGRRPVRYISATAGPSDTLDDLISATNPDVLKGSGIGGAKHCIFHVRIEGENGLPDAVDFAVASPDLVRQWVDGLSALLHIGSVGIGLQVKQSGGRFLVVGALRRSPAHASGLFLQGDFIEEIDTMRLTAATTFAQFEALVLGPINSAICIAIDRQGHKMVFRLRRGPIGASPE